MVVYVVAQYVTICHKLSQSNFENLTEYEK